MGLYRFACGAEVPSAPISAKDILRIAHDATIGPCADCPTRNAAKPERVDGFRDRKTGVVTTAPMVSCLARYVDAVLTGADPRDITRSRDHADRLDAAGLHDEAHELRRMAKHDDDGEGA